MSMQIEQSLFLPLLFACQSYGYPLLLVLVSEHSNRIRALFFCPHELFPNAADSPFGVDADCVASGHSIRAEPARRLVDPLSVRCELEQERSRNDRDCVCFCRYHFAP